MVTIDLNADLGETTAGNPVADDASMIKLVSSANIACGFHAGDPHDIARTVESAVARGVTVGAHVGYRDSAGFGRRFMDYAPTELADEVLYQIGALEALSRKHGTTIRYVKPHGALYNAIVHHEVQAQAVIDGIRAFDPDLAVMLLPGAVAMDYAHKAGMQVIAEAFADRNYQPDGTLVSRQRADAVISDPDQVADRVLQIASEGTITAVDGTLLNVDATSVCVHGDSPGSVAMTKSIVDRLAAEGVSIRSVL
ncbi:LamB/YcsF family protein [Corynebacterium alimapuense]|uniref:5-oxoprolinase subunit A n=1 Tax=Corynebacterium alimapuense TaxID=1576874 RepID=A0A3M8K7Y7_9CORY|nr:5-oxoprolinase subunit PxpA [Corynebacterium alimapuense]RNE48672.1 LamB/YcsF family protein [Corynebacterium alimapuense]